MRISIKVKVLLTVLTVGFLPGAVGILSTYIKGSEVFKESTGQNLNYIAHQIAANIHTIIDKEASESLLIAGHPGVRPLVQLSNDALEWYRQSVSDYLKQEISYEPYTSISISDINGNIILREGTKLDRQFHNDKVLSLLNDTTAAAVMDTPFKSQLTGHFIIPIYTPIRTSNKGEIIGIIGAFLDVSKLFEGVHVKKAGEIGHFNLATATGTVIFDPVLPNPPSFSQPVMDKITGGKEPWFVDIDEHGIESVHSYTRITINPGAIFSYEGKEALYVIFTKPTFEAFETPIRKVLFNAALPGFLLAILLVFAIYMALKKTIQPISALKEGAAIIGRGDLNHRIEIDSGDEIEDLADEFNKMTAELKSSYTGLEDKVAERTLELEASYEELEKASSLKIQFLAGLSHELRTPLNGIMGFSDVLIEEVYGKINDKQRKYLTNIHQSGKHLLEVINDILDLSKIEAGKMSLHLRKVSVADAMMEIHGLVKQLADDAGVKLSFDADKAPAVIIADNVRLRQIMYNLLSNAIKFTREGGSVNVTANQREQDLVVAVTDNGIGIAKEDCQMIFTAFRQVDASSTRGYEGTGLGLALTKKFVEMHGGNISVVSALGEGSTFTFNIPISGPDDIPKDPGKAN